MPFGIGKSPIFIIRLPSVSSHWQSLVAFCCIRLAEDIGSLGQHPILYVLLLVCVLMLAVATVPPRFWRLNAYPLHAVVFFLLVVLVIIEQDGVNRWLDLGIIRVQPAECAKITLILALARFYSDKDSISMQKWTASLIPLTLALSSCVLIALQPDLGTATLLFINSLLIMVLVATNMRVLLLLLAALFAAAPFLWQMMLHDYQKARLLAFLYPQQDPLGQGYQILQSHIAIGSGGWTGKGFLQGSQSYLDFLPEKHNDFIFTLLAEEHGFIGASLFLMLALLLDHHHHAYRLATAERTTARRVSV